MRICSLVYHRPDTTPAGVEVTLWKLSKQLVELGSEVHIVYEEGTCDAQELTVDEVYLHGVGGEPHEPVSEKVYLMRSTWQRLREIEKKFAPNIYAFHGVGSLLPIFRFRKQSLSPFAYHTYAALPYEAQRHLMSITRTSFSEFVRKSLMYGFYTTLEIAALRRVDKVILPTARTIEELRSWYNCPRELMSVVPLGQDLFERYGTNPRDGRIAGTEKNRVLLFVGNDWYRKGLKYLLMAFRELAKKFPDLILVVTGPPQAPLIRLAEELGIKGSVMFVGNVDERTLAALYGECDIFVLPSLHEGFSNTIIEVMAFGKPVITTEIAGFPVVNHGVEGLLVESTDYKALSSSIELLLRNTELYAEMSKRASKKAQEYTWRKAAERLLRIYETMQS